MSYVHCHGCNWSQDDFWSLRGYNPVRWFLKYDIPQYIRPRMINFDPPPHSYGRVFSWKVLGLRLWAWCRRMWTQHWWSRRSWIAALDRGEGGCPKCGHRLCED